MTMTTPMSNFITSVFIFLIPGLLICLDLIPSIKIPMRLPYLLAPIVSVIMSVVSILLYKSKSSSSVSFGGDSSMDISLHIKIGFIITILLFIAIIVYTLIHDFALNKDAIKEKGLKGAISDIAGEVSEEMSETVKKTNFELPSSKCPQCGEKVEIKVYPENCESCGKPLIKGKNYCPDCGTKFNKFFL